MWSDQVFVQIVLTRIPFVQLLGGLIPIWILFVLITTIAIFGIVNVIRLLRMWRRGETIADGAVRLRIWLYVAMGCLCWCVFVLSTPETFSGPFRLRFPIAAWITASLAYGIGCALPRLRFRVSSRTRRRLDVIGMNVTVTLVLAEIVLQVASVFSSNPLLITESTSSQLRRDSERMEPGALRFSFPINSRGHYDTEFLPPAERSLPLVVCIGDSFSYGVVPHHYHYTTVAEREFPGAEIYNMGFPGLGPGDYLHLLVEEALPLDPDLVVIALFVGNDVVTEDGSAPPTRWYDAQRYMVGIVWHRLQILRRAQGNDWTQDSPDTIDEALVGRYPWLVDPSLEKPSLGEDIYRELESRNAFVGAADLPGVYERFFAVLRKIEDAAGDVPIAYLIIPDEYQVDDELWQTVVEKNDFPLQRDRPQRKIRQWAEAGDRDFVDLLPLLLAAEPLPDGKRHVYHLRDTHINARGNEIVGRALAKLIEAKFAEADAAVPVPELPLHVEFGTPESRIWMHSGWSHDEPGRVWSNATESTLKIPLPSESDLRMQIRCMPFAFPGAPEQRVEILVNKKPIDTLVITPGKSDYTVVLPGPMLRNRVDRVDFRYAYTRTPADVISGSEDLRALSVAWLSIKFSELESPAQPSGTN